MKHSKINNIRFKNPTRCMILYKLYTLKGAILPRMILFLCIFYLLQEPGLHHNHYFGQKINMNSFIQASGYDLDMHANIQCMNMHGFL
jgi:hypothetical protein